MSSEPSDLVDRAQGKSLTDIAKNSFGGWLFAVAYSVITGTQQLFELLFLPFELFVEVGQAAIQWFFIEPLRGVIPAGIAQTAQGLATFDFFGLPVGVAIVLVTFGIVALVSSLEVTSNVVPGLIADNPLWDFIFGSPEEESSDD